MNREAFWQKIEIISRDLLLTGDDEGSVEPLVACLATFPPKEIRSFEEHLARHLFALDGPEFAAHAGESGTSADGFLYARCYVVALGKAHYQGVLHDPTMMPSGIDCWCEPLLFAGAKAWGLRTGRDAEEWDSSPSVCWETGSNAELWKTQSFPHASAPRPAAKPDPEIDLARAVTAAGHAFKTGNHARLIELLAPHEGRLSVRQLRMLELARSEGNT